MAAAVGLPPAQPFIIELTDVSKDYDTGGSVVRAMRDVNLAIEHGEFVAIVGTSGSGKSTMMNILGCLDRPSRGTYTLAGLDVGARKGDSRAIVRNRVIGFIFQGFNLLSRTTALENVELPLQYRGVSARERRRRATKALESVGLGARLDHTPNQLSGGQQQRVAIARALVTDPPLLLADEPTGNLDTRTSLEVLALLQNLNRERGITIVLVTHERDIAACASRVVTMRDGCIVTDVRQDRPMDAAAELAALPRADDSATAPRGASDATELAAARIGGPVPFGVYPMMLVGELLGEAVALAYMTLVLELDSTKALLGARLLGELGKAWLGARWVRRSLGRPATSDQRVRMALGYTLAVTGGAVCTALVVLPPLPLPALALSGVWTGIAAATAHGPAALAALVFAGGVLPRPPALPPSDDVQPQAMTWTTSRPTATTISSPRDPSGRWSTRRCSRRRSPVSSSASASTRCSAIATSWCRWRSASSSRPSPAHASARAPRGTLSARSRAPGSRRRARLALVALSVPLAAWLSMARHAQPASRRSGRRRTSAPPSPPWPSAPPFAGR